jgi:hypothetical protein
MSRFVFVSYSRKDKKLMQPVARALRGTFDQVYVDVTETKPGTKWQQTIDDALKSADLIVLFWCRHAATSPAVKREYELGLSNSKAIMPLLLDTTPLPKCLEVFEWVDFRDLFASSHPSRLRVVIRWVTRTVFGVLLLGSLIIYSFPSRSKPINERDIGATKAGTTKVGAPEGPPHRISLGISWNEVLAVATVIILLILLFGWIALKFSQARNNAATIAARFKLEIDKRGFAH